MFRIGGCQSVGMLKTCANLQGIDSTPKILDFIVAGSSLFHAAFSGIWGVLISAEISAIQKISMIHSSSKSEVDQGEWAVDEHKHVNASIHQ